MRREHLERLRPICPVCREPEAEPAALALTHVAREQDGDVREGSLQCTAEHCLREYPIVDGIPVVVADLAGWATHQLDAVLRRRDLTAFMESLLGDASGPGSSLDRERSNLSGYAHAHWATDDHATLAGTAFALAGGGSANGSDSGAGPGPGELWADLGCATGRATLELQRRTGTLAVGVDLSFGMLRVAEEAVRTGRAVFPLRRIGVVYDRVEVEVDRSGIDPAQIGFWCADVAALPFADDTFAGALSLNVLDCVHEPFTHLAELARTSAQALLSTPYDWSPMAVPLHGWIGGHSQRAPHAGDGPAALRQFLPHAGLTIAAEREEVPWRVRGHDRSSTEYLLHLLHLTRA